jgi:alpha-glucosidase (family GH31 glycosyl hydrolase)
VYLPSGELWYDIMSTTCYDEQDGRYRIGYSDSIVGGKSVTVSAPLNICPLFVRAGSIIPTVDPAVFTLNNASHDGVISLFDKRQILHLWIWPDQSNQATSETLYDGSRFIYAPSASGTTITSMDTQPNRTLIIQLLFKNSPNTVKSSQYDLDRVSSWKDLVKDDGSSAWTFDGELKVLWIRMVAMQSVYIN